MRLEGIAQGIGRVAGAQEPAAAILRQAAPVMKDAPESEAPEAEAPEAVLSIEQAESRLDEVVQTVNDRLFRVNRRMELYVVDGTNDVAARIVDTRSNEVVKSLPPEEVLAFRSRMNEMLGLLFDEGA